MDFDMTCISSLSHVWMDKYKKNVIFLKILKKNPKIFLNLFGITI